MHANAKVIFGLLALLVIFGGGTWYFLRQWRSESLGGDRINIIFTAVLTLLFGLLAIVSLAWLGVYLYAVAST